MQARLKLNILVFFFPKKHVRHWIFIKTAIYVCNNEKKTKRRHFMQFTHTVFCHESPKVEWYWFDKLHLDYFSTKSKTDQTVIKNIILMFSLPSNCLHPDHSHFLYILYLPHSHAVYAVIINRAVASQLMGTLSLFLQQHNGNAREWVSEQYRTMLRRVGKVLSENRRNVWVREKQESRNG